MSLRVLSWNLKHGRAEPPAGRNLFDEFADALAGWVWDAALLQEVPPWWPALLGERLDAEWRLVLTSRNGGLALRRAIAIRWPDLIKSNGGGGNAILIRRGTIAAHRTRRLRVLPERRWLHAVHVSTPSVWIGNLHATGGHPGAAAREAQLAARTMLAWAGDAPVVLGGDFNLRSLSLDGLVRAGGYGVDHIFVRGLRSTSEPEILERGRLSDHTPVLASVEGDEKGSI